MASAVGGQTTPLTERATRCLARLFGASVVITGTPQARASSAAIPKPSRSEAVTKAFAPFVLASSS